MKQIWKYRLKDAVIQELALPECATILAAGVQGEEIMLWAEIEDRFLHTERRTILVYGTGHEIEYEGKKQHIGTVFMGPFVFHVFEGLGA